MCSTLPKFLSLEHRSQGTEPLYLDTVRFQKENNPLSQFPSHEGPLQSVSNQLLHHGTLCKRRQKFIQHEDTLPPTYQWQAVKLFNSLIPVKLWSLHSEQGPSEDSSEPNQMLPPATLSQGTCSSGRSQKKKHNNPHLVCTFKTASMHKLLREKRCVQISYISKLKKRLNEEGNLHSQVGYVSFCSYVFVIKMQFLVNNAHLRFLSG